MWRHDRSPDLTTDVTTELTGEFTGKVTGTMGGDGQGEGRDNAAGLAAADQRIDRRIDCRIDRRTGHRTGRRIGRRIDWATTSLTPYGMSVWALILAACGGGGGGGGGPTTSGPAPAAQPQMLQRSGQVYDGPVRDAGVYVDVDGDGRLNKQIDYFIGKTNALGHFSGRMPAQHQGKRYIVDLTGATDLGDDGREGGTGVNADRPLNGTWLAPEGSSVVSALTHLIATGITTRQQVESAFPNFNPLVDNPYGLELTQQKKEAYAAVREALPGITRFIEENRDLINENARKIKGLETTVANLEEKVGTLQQQFVAAVSGSRPDITKSGRFTLELIETTDSATAFTGLSFAVSDADGNFTGPPTVNDDRFELRRFGQEWQLWVKAGQRFSADETISLNIIATDTTRHLDIETVSITVGNIEHAPVLTLSGSASLNEGTLPGDTDTGVTFNVTDADSEESGYRPPVVTVSGGNNRFKIVGNRLVAMDDAIFTSGERITLTITATDGNNARLADAETVSFTVEAAPAEDPPASNPSPIQSTNTPPTGSDKVKAGVHEDNPTTFIATDFTGGASANDPGQDITHVVITGLPTFGTLQLNNVAVTKGQEIRLDQLSDLAFALEGGGRGYFKFKLKDSGSADNNRNLSAEYTMRVDVVAKSDPGDIIDDVPSKMAFENHRNSVSFEEGTTIKAGFLAKVMFKDPDIRDAWFAATREEQYINAVEIASINGLPILSGSLSAPLFEIRNHDELYLTSDRTFNFERLATISRFHQPNWQIVLRHKFDGQKILDDLIFTVNVTNVEEAPVMLMDQRSAPVELPTRTTVEFDTGIRFNVSDPDSLPRAFEDVALRLSHASFLLKRVDHRLNPISEGAPSTKVQYYKLMAKAGQNFTPGQEIEVVITANDSTGNASLATTQSVTITVAEPSDPVSQPQDTVNDPPTAMSFQDNVSSVTMNEGVVLQGRRLATIEFTDPDTSAAFLNNEVEIYSVDGFIFSNRLELGRVFEIRNGNELWLKQGGEIEYDRRYRTSEGSPSEEAADSYTIVLRHKTDGVRLDDLIFTLNVNDVNEAPVIQTLGNANTLPVNIVERLFTGVRLKIYDPDNIVGVETRNSSVAVELSDTRFDLVELPPGNRPVPWQFNEDPPSKEYAIFAHAGQQFTAGQTISLTIRASDGTHTTTQSVTITILPATSAQTSGQGGGRAMTEVVSYDDFSPDAGMEELGAPLAEVL